MRTSVPILALACLIALSMGCIKDRLLFATKSVVGLDIDSQPPASELSINRKEGVIEPVFEGGQTPPVLASFKADMNPLARFFGYGIGSTFATGDAAEALSSLFSMPDKDFNKIINARCAAKRESKLSDQAALLKGNQGKVGAKADPAPSSNGEEQACGQFFKERKELLAEQFGSWIALTKPPEGNFIGAADSDLLVFATDSVVGLKVDWLNGLYPSGVKFGFNRKEATWAPLALCTTPAGQSSACFYNVSPDVANERQGRILARVTQVLTKEISGDLLKQQEESKQIMPTNQKDKENEDKLRVQQAEKQAAEVAPTKLVHVLIAPSLVATLDSTASLEEKRTSGLKYQQYFATGRAATNLAAHQHVRRALMPEFEDTMEPEMEEFYIWTGQRLVRRLGTLSTAEIRDRVYTFAQAWKVIDPIVGYTNADNIKLVEAVKKKIESTEKCFAQSDRSKNACKENRAISKVSGQELTYIRDLLVLCE